MTLIEALKHSKSVYRPINNCRLIFSKDCDEATELCRICLNDLLATDWEPIIEKKTKEVWQWRYSDKQGTLRVDDILQDEKGVNANAYLKGWIKFEKHAGPFEVPCD